MYKAISCFVFGLICCLSLKAQNTEPAFDVQHYRFAIQLTDANDTIKGQAKVRIKFLKDVGSLQLDLVKQKDAAADSGSNAGSEHVRNNKKAGLAGKGMLVSSVTEDDKAVTFTQDVETLDIKTDAKANSTHSYTIIYQGIPADGLIISTNKFGHRTFFGDNWPNRAHNWLPCVDYPVDKAQVDFVVTAPDHYGVVANGLKVEETVLPNHYKLTHWKETAQLPTKVMVIGVADFAIDHPGDANGVPVYTYVFPENKEVGFKNYAVATQILPFYMKNVGPYAYKKLANVQSKTIFGGMENAGAIFYFENSTTTKGIEELMAHEIAHQWFGDAASERNFGHVWLSEGFATYMTNLYLESKYGPDTLKKREAEDRLTVFSFEKRRYTPIVDTLVKSNYMQLLNANSYQKGGWVLHMLRRKLGDEAFWKGIRAYYAKYNGGNAYTSGLQKIMEQASGKDLKQFFQQWLYTTGHPDLGIKWKYNAGIVEVTVTQNQDTLYELPLEIAIGNEQHTISLKDRITVMQFKTSAKPTEIKADPNVNLLATFAVAEGN
ncbi:M1 family metallopeptidase [Mucilaginibacter sp. BJC16-A38]|uniref:M1 family metallopeptidase n=1 Tax=Mucilaginibacter phenanthrenivorans TaxID=1234842 RepID=UPI002157C0EB|nr:M1 family metallopeptidase [Mucilaginibacter phenanthrenivorans]MCR8557518.1 M1 family metallopeptidase [Mucilaginibacter phenanthrenivorans]